MDIQISIGDHIDLIARLSSNTWNGTTTSQLIVKEIIREVLSKTNRN